MVLMVQTGPLTPMQVACLKSLIINCPHDKGVNIRFSQKDGKPSLLATCSSRAAAVGGIGHVIDALVKADVKKVKTVVLERVLRLMTGTKLGQRYRNVPEKRGAVFHGQMETPELQTAFRNYVGDSRPQYSGFGV